MKKEIRGEEILQQLMWTPLEAFLNIFPEICLFDSFLKF
jgi:hypothetical protein